jgi:2-oxoglutarate ferredoxin oxidoreductase subunit alpha
MERLRKKLDTACELLPAPIVRAASGKAEAGVIYYGSTAPAMNEALADLAAHGVHLDAMRVRGFPFADEVFRFIDAHDQVFVVEQNEGAQLRMLIVNEGDVDPKKLTRVLHYDGTPITARFIAGAIRKELAPSEATPIRQVIS